MRLKVKKGVIWDLDKNEPVGALLDSATEEVEREIELGSEAIPIIEQFILDVNSGSFKPKAAVAEFEKIVEKYEI